MMSEKRKIQRFNLDEGRIWEAIEGLSPYKTTYTLEEVCEQLGEQQATIEHLTKSRDKWSKSFNCLEKAIEIAYEEKPYPKIEDIMNIYSKLEKEIDDE